MLVLIVFVIIAPERTVDMLKLINMIFVLLGVFMLMILLFMTVSLCLSVIIFYIKHFIKNLK